MDSSFGGSSGPEVLGLGTRQPGADAMTGTILHLPRRGDWVSIDESIAFPNRTGRVVAVWNVGVTVEFDGAIGIYTLGKNTFRAAEQGGGALANASD